METGQPTPTASSSGTIIQRVLEDAGIEFLDPIEGVRGEGVCFKWGVAPPARQPGEGTATGADGEGGMKAAWDDFEEDADADLDALLGEVPAPDPSVADYWRTDPELWGRLSEGGRETLSRTMFGDMRAAAADYFRPATKPMAPRSMPFFPFDHRRNRIEPLKPCGSEALTTHHFSTLPKGVVAEMRRWRQNCNRRRPRLNQEIMPRATFLRCAAGAFFNRHLVFHRIPHSGRNRPIERKAKNENQAVEPVCASDLTVFQIEAACFVMRWEQAAHVSMFSRIQREL